MSRASVGSVAFRNVTKSFGGFTAVDDLSLTIEPGTLVTLLGPSGCGKTTTLRMLAGLEHPTSGQILIDGQDVTALPANERDVSMVFQSYALFPHMTCLENVAYGLESSGMKRVEAAGRAQDAMELVGLATLGQRLPAELSGGQQQRVAVARAMVLQPRVLLLDEPLSNLDARLRRRMRTEIRDLQQKLGFTAVYVTHDQEEALAVSDRIVVMKDGRIAQQGGPRELYEAPVSSFIANFMGEANVLDCDILDSGETGVSIRVGGLTHLVRAGRVSHRGPGKIAVRPGSFLLHAPSETPFEGRIAQSAFLGDHFEYEIETAAGTLFVVDFGLNRELRVQELISIGLKEHGVSVLTDAI